MEEKIVEAKFKKNKLAQALLIAGLGLIFIGFMISLSVYTNGEGYQSFGFGYGGVYPYDIIYDTYVDFLAAFFAEWGHLFVLMFYLGVFSILASFFFRWEMSRCALTVTNRRVTGRASFGKTVDLPLNQISAVGLGIFSRITAATSSGRIHFWFIENRSEVHEALTDIIGKVQVESAYSHNNNSNPLSGADELKKYKDLLDSGVITQEEFEAKKKELLGL